MLKGGRKPSPLGTPIGSATKAGQQSSPGLCAAITCLGRVCYSISEEEGRAPHCLERSGLRPDAGDGLVSAGQMRRTLRTKAMADPSHGSGTHHFKSTATVVATGRARRDGDGRQRREVVANQVSIAS